MIQYDLYDYPGNKYNWKSHTMIPENLRERHKTTSTLNNRFSPTASNLPTICYGKSSLAHHCSQMLCCVNYPPHIPFGQHAAHIVHRYLSASQLVAGAAAASIPHGLKLYATVDVYSMQTHTHTRRLSVSREFCACAVIALSAAATVINIISIIS